MSCGMNQMNNFVGVIENQVEKALASLSLSVKSEIGLFFSNEFPAMETMLLRSVPIFVMRREGRPLKTLTVEGTRILEIMGSKLFL